jgi:hypothetical protein
MTPLTPTWAARLVALWLLVALATPVLAQRTNDSREHRRRQFRNTPTPTPTPNPEPENPTPNTPATLRGQLLDGETGEGLAGGTVRVEGTGTGTLTDYQGNFTLTGLPPGPVVVRVSYVGYVDTTLNLTLRGGENALDAFRVAPDAIGLQAVEVLAALARDRQTPVAISSIDLNYRLERGGNQELPMLLKLTPSVYTSYVGGGFGDSRIAIRGFQQEEVAVLINGIPVNDMNAGRVFWSNWLGLNDVLRTMQVQRGLGATRLALPSIGGTINMITRTTDLERGGSITLETGSVYSLKSTLALSTGRSAKGFAATFVGSRTVGPGYVDRTHIDAWSYYLSLAQELGRRHLISLNALGAPQTHDQRNTRLTPSEWQARSSTRFNPDWGLLQGQPLNSSTNYYHKPQVALNHQWQIAERSLLTTSLYGTWGRGGGSGVNTVANEAGSRPSLRNNAADSLLNWDALYAFNRGSNLDTVFDAQTGNILMRGHRAYGVLRYSVLNHNQYGAISTFQQGLGPYFQLLAGLDVRTYTSEHYRKLENLLGGDYFIETGYENDPELITLNQSGQRDTLNGRIQRLGDVIDYHYKTRLNNYGGFATLEYNTPRVSAYVSTALCNSTMHRTELMNPTRANAETEGHTAAQSPTYSFLGYNAKAGLNVRLGKPHNVFANLGYFERAPFYRFVFNDERFSNATSRNPKNERVLGLELGYGLHTRRAILNINGYYTRWMDKGLRTTYTRADGIRSFVNIPGVQALHTGIEVDGHWQPLQWLQVNGMLSLGNWTWQNNVTAYIQNEATLEQDTLNLFIKGLKVGDAAQTTASLGLRFQPGPGFYLAVDFSHYANLYAAFTPESRTAEADAGQQAWRLPAYNLVDAHAGYTFRVGATATTLRLSCTNLLNHAYIMEARDGTTHDAQTGRVFYGFGRNFNLSLQMRF